MLKEVKHNASIASVKKRRLSSANNPPILPEVDKESTSDSEDPFDPAEAFHSFEEVEEELSRREASSNATLRRPSQSSTSESSEQSDSSEADLEDIDLPFWRDWPEFEDDSYLTETLKAKALTMAANISFPKRLLKNIANLEWQRPMLVQQAVIPLAVVSRNNIQIASETGSGKTGAFTIPCIVHMLSDAKLKALNTLAIAPSHELATQVGEIFQRLCQKTKIIVCVLVGGISIEKQRRLLGKGPHVVVGTVGRLKALIVGEDEKCPADKAFDNLGKRLRHVVIDEADRILEFGKLKDVKDIFARIEKTKAVDASTNTHTCQYFLASATLAMSSQNVADILPVKKWLTVDLTSPEFQATRESIAAFKLPKGARFAVVYESHANKFVHLYLKLLAYIDSDQPFRVLVFANTIDFAQKIEQFISLILDHRLSNIKTKHASFKGTASRPTKRDALHRTMSYVPLTDLITQNGVSESRSTEKVNWDVRNPEPMTKTPHSSLTDARNGEQPEKACSVKLLTSRLKQAQRYKVFDAFKAPACRCVLVATDIAARGLDFPNVNLVIHAQCPRSKESLIHRSGRTARGVNGEGEVVFLIHEEEKSLFKDLTTDLFGDEVELEEVQLAHASKLWCHASEICATANELETTLYRHRKRSKEIGSRKSLADTAGIVDSDVELELIDASNSASAQQKRIDDLRHCLRSLLSERRS